MPAPRSLRIARLLLVGAGVGGLALFAFIAAAASGFAPVVLVIPATAVILLVAARELERDRTGGQLLAIAGACGLAGMGVLAGFGAGFLSLPIASLAVAAAWAAALAPPRRARVIGLALYVAFGLAVLAIARVPLSLFSLWSPLLWPWLGAVWSGPASWLAIYGSFGASAALLALYAAHRYGVPLSRRAVPRIAALGALAGGALVVGAYAAIAALDTSSSLRFEMEPLPLAILLAAGALLGAGLTSLGRAPAVAAVSLAVAFPVLLLAVAGGPAVTCYANGVRTGAGPWWMPYTGSQSASGGGGSARGVSGEIRRGDGVVIRYRCDGAQLVEFAIER